MVNFLHQQSDFKQLLDATARQENINDPSLVEKDYWLMHCLFGLQDIGLTFELKGGTSLSKGYELIHRFSEDIDIRINPDEVLTGFKVYSGKNHQKNNHQESRKKYFDWLAQFIKGKISGLSSVERDLTFDDPSGRYRNGGIRLNYDAVFPAAIGLKEGILLEVGFDRTAPNQSRTISSWAYKRASQVSGLKFIDNRAQNVLCYEPKYTFVEKLQTVVRKYRLFKEDKHGKNLPPNFLRHYYDLFQLIDLHEVQSFIGTEEYEAYKHERFKPDNPKVSDSEAFRLSNGNERKIFEKEYERTAALYYKERPSFDEILKRMARNLERL